VLRDGDPGHEPAVDVSGGEHPVVDVVDRDVVHVPGEDHAVQSVGGDGEPVAHDAGHTDSAGGHAGSDVDRSVQHDPGVVQHDSGTHPGVASHDGTTAVHGGGEHPGDVNAGHPDTGPHPNHNNTNPTTAHERMGDTHASDGSDLVPGETHTTMRGFELRAPSSEEVAYLDSVVARVDSPIVKVDGHYYLKDPIDVHFDADSYFRNHGIDPDAQYKDGLTYRDEYNRQLQLQQNGMNDLSVGEWQHNRADFEKSVSEGGGRVGQNELAAAREAAGGVPGDDTAVLHGPDQVAGGRPDVFDGLGDSGINSSIGSQWQSRIDRLDENVDSAVVSVPAELLSFVHMQVRLLPT
jgi:hypothetical protein